MPYADRLKQNEWARKWIAARRAAFFNGKSCAKCGSCGRLELDHIDPETKVHHSIWSWSESRRVIETAKCQVLCHACHLDKTINIDPVRKAEDSPMASLSNYDVIDIRILHAFGVKQSVLCARFGVPKQTMSSIVNRVTWKSL